MEGRDTRDPGYDDWFDEPEPPTETQSAVSRGPYEDAEEVWVLPEEGDRPQRRREIVVAGRTLTTAQAAIIGVSILAIFFAILAAFGVFNGSKPAPLRVAPPPPKHTATSTQTSTATNTTPTTQAPSQPLNPGDTGPQVKLLQQALTKLGFSPGKPDGDYGINTKVAVERFQAAKGLGQDGVVGAQTLAEIQKDLAG